jgi:hypothetical protein
MADPLASAELELRIVLLPPISRGAHLNGPALRARQLVKLWGVNGDDDVPLAQAFRLLDVEAVTGAILRTLLMDDKDYPADPCHWTFPGFTDLLPELQELSWRAMLDGALLTEAIKSVRGKRYRAVLPAELPRLTPDWELSRLTFGGRDDFINVRVRRAPAEPVKKAWRKRPNKAAVRDSMKQVAQTYPLDAQPPFSEIWDRLKELSPGVTREVAREALKQYAPHLVGRRGYRSKSKSPI